MKQNFWILLIILACSAVACKSGQKKDGNMEKETVLKIETSMGDIKVKLYNETPKHRDNFIKLAKDGTYNGTLFHRVIKDFMRERKPYIIVTASAAAVASSSSEQLAKGMAVRSHTAVWKFIRASSLPCETSVW